VRIPKIQHFGPDWKPPYTLVVHQTYNSTSSIVSLQRHGVKDTKYVSNLNLTNTRDPRKPALGRMRLYLHLNQNRNRSLNLNLNMTRRSLAKLLSPLKFLAKTFPKIKKSDLVPPQLPLILLKVQKPTVRRKKPLVSLQD